MDLNGRNKLEAVLDEGLRVHDVGTWVGIEPHEYEFTGAEDADETSVESVRFLDVSTHASPGRVLESLRRAHMLESAGCVTLREDSSPRLRHIGTTNNSRVYTLTFEDMAEERQ